MDGRLRERSRAAADDERKIVSKKTDRFRDD
jgi:hypothetical protein